MRALRRGSRCASAWWPQPEPHALLTSSPEGVTAYLDADLRDTGAILAQAAGTLDFTQPVAVMLLAILHYIPDLAEGNHVGRPRELVAQFFAGLDLLEPGVVKVTQWRPASDVEASGPTSLWGGVGRKR